MTDTPDIRNYADAIMAMIEEDEESGQVPRGVCSWDELDDSVDTDDYCRQAHLPSGTREAADLHSAVSEEITRRLSRSQGGPWHVDWDRPEGSALDIGRTIGYATRALAEAVGQAYVTEHGGAFRVHGG
jgi:hypothetical protein